MVGARRVRMHAARTMKPKYASFAVLLRSFGTTNARTFDELAYVALNGDRTIKYSNRIIFSHRTIFSLNKFYRFSLLAARIQIYFFQFNQFRFVVCLSVRRWLLDSSLSFHPVFFFFSLVKALREMTHTHAPNAASANIRILLIIKLIQEPNANKPNTFLTSSASALCDLYVSISSSAPTQIVPEIGKYYVSCICLGQTESHQSDQKLRTQNSLESESIERRAIGRNVIGKVFLRAFECTSLARREREKKLISTMWHMESSVSTSQRDRTRERACERGREKRVNRQ